MSEPTSNDKNAPFFVDTEVIKLTRNGIWLSDSTEITHEGTRKLFAKSIHKDSQGYFLRVGRERKLILVEDTAYFVTRIEGSIEKGLTLYLNDETKEPLRPETLKYQPERLTCLLARGEEAKFLRAPYMDLLKQLQEDHGHYYLTVQGKRIELQGK